jgi:hypothetical protein
MTDADIRSVESFVARPAGLGGAGTSSAKRYREFMEQCVRWAKAARTEQERATYLQLAQTWYEAARRIEENLGRIGESTDLIKRSQE